MKPFLLLATRSEDGPADEEYALFLRYSGLDERDLVRVRLEATPLPAVDLDDYSGIFVGGGPFNASDPYANKSPVQRRVEAEFQTLLDEVVARDFPFLGACYGIGTRRRAPGRRRSTARTASRSASSSSRAPRPGHPIPCWRTCPTASRRSSATRRR